MEGIISFGTTGTGENKKYMNAHLYSESAEYLDRVNRIGYLFSENNELKISEYKRGTRGSRYSSLYKLTHLNNTFILEEPLAKLGALHDKISN